MVCSLTLGFESFSISGSGLFRSTLCGVWALFEGFVCLTVMHVLRGLSFA